MPVPCWSKSHGCLVAVLYFSGSHTNTFGSKCVPVHHGLQCFINIAITKKPLWGANAPLKFLCQLFGAGIWGNTYAHKTKAHLPQPVEKRALGIPTVVLHPLPMAACLLSRELITRCIGFTWQPFCGWGGGLQEGLLQEDSVFPYIWHKQCWPDQRRMHCCPRLRQ